MADQVVQRVVFKCADNVGKIGSMALMVVLDASSDPILDFTGFYTLFNAVSDAVITGQIGETANNTIVGTAASNAYDVRDKLAVEFVGSQNDHHTIHIGDLDPAILNDDNETVDPANAAWIALKSAIQTNVKDKLGNAVKVVRGYRQRSRNLKSSMRFE